MILKFLEIIRENMDSYKIQRKRIAQYVGDGKSQRVVIKNMTVYGSQKNIELWIILKKSLYKKI